MIFDIPGRSRNQQSSLARYVARVESLTQRDQADLAIIRAIRLRRADALMKSVFEGSFDAILVIRQDGRIEIANEAAARLFLSTEDDLFDQPASNLIPEVQSRLARDIESVNTCGRYSETEGQRLDGSKFPLELALGSIDLAGDTLHVAIVRDITERKQQREQLTHQALHDALTGLPNRVLFSDRLEHSLNMARRGGDSLAVAILLLDLDRFKEVNDTLGHHVGDLLLREVAQRLETTIRKTDTIARLGGDEFAVVLPAVSDLARAQRVSSRMIRALQQPFEVNGLTIEVGVSIGIALFPEHAEEKEKLLQCADVAMYAAKQTSPSVMLYDFDTDQNSIRHLTLTGELRRAIEGHRIELAYQPKLNLETGQICGVEALARWRHPVHGNIVPDEFIQQAERTGLINGLTHLTMDTALEQLARWHQAGHELHMAINLSARSLHVDTLPELLGSLLAKWGMDAGHVILEITESAIMIDPAKALAVAEQITGMGLRLSIDDFGTGYSSLSYLSRLPVCELKIDRSFVSHMIDRNEDASIVQSTIDLAHNLNLKVVAEGIESEAILGRLAELGCDLGQGYFIGQPMPADDLMREREQKKANQ